LNILIAPCRIWALLGRQRTCPLMNEASPNRLIAVELDDTLGLSSSADAEHERQVAINDLLEQNTFALLNGIPGPYRLRLSSADGRLVFSCFDHKENPVYTIALSLMPFRKIVKDYFAICESYNVAIRTGSASHIETLDMARRGIHNEGSELLQSRMKGKAEFDFDTARRLFTLVCALVWKS
jgi:uncharacterized protein (UPF0262 family)